MTGPTLQIVFEEVDAGVARQLGPHLDGKRMRELLLNAGLVRDVEETGDPDAPQEWLAALRGLLFEVLAAEDALASARRVPTWLRFSAPPYWFVWVPGVFAGTVGLSMLLGDTFEERGLWLSRFALGGATAAAAVVGWTIAHNLRERRAIRREEAAARAVRDALRADLLAGVTALLGRSFAARLGPRHVLLHTPHLDWVEARLGYLGAGEGASDAGALRGDLVVLRDALRQGVMAARQGPPETWVALDAGLNLRDVARRWDACGLPRRADEAERWALLGLEPHD